MRTVSGCLRKQGRLGVLPSPFNPPTRAHLALAQGAQDAFGLDQIALVLPEALPHKRVERPGVPDRLRWLALLARDRRDRAVLTGRPALVVDIVRSLRTELEVAAALYVIAGRDAAERYEQWDYGEEEPFHVQLRSFTLLVAARDGEHDVDPRHAGRILPFHIPGRYAHVSSSRVRDALRGGGPWRDMVPTAIHREVAEAYSGGA